jgi:hypothetical protein
MNEKEIDNLFEGKKVTVRPLSKLQIAHQKYLEQKAKEEAKNRASRNSFSPKKKVGFLSRLFKKR